MGKSGHWRVLVSTGQRVPKRHYSRSEAIERAARMTEEYGQLYHVYPCLACGGRHIGRPGGHSRHATPVQVGETIRLPRDYLLDYGELGYRAAAHLAWENTRLHKDRLKVIRQRFRVALARAAGLR